MLVYICVHRASCRCVQSVIHSLVILFCGISRWATVQRSAVWGSMAGLALITHNADRLYTQNLLQPQEPKLCTGELNWFHYISEPKYLTIAAKVRFFLKYVNGWENSSVTLNCCIFICCKYIAQCRHAVVTKCSRDPNTKSSGKKVDHEDLLLLW